MSRLWRQTNKCPFVECAKGNYAWQAVSMEENQQCALSCTKQFLPHTHLAPHPLRHNKSTDIYTKPLCNIIYIHTHTPNHCVIYHTDIHTPNHCVMYYTDYTHQTTVWYIIQIYRYSIYTHQTVWNIIHQLYKPNQSVLGSMLLEQLLCQNVADIWLFNSSSMLDKAKHFCCILEHSK